MSEDKKTITTIDSILKGYELRQFYAAKQAWGNLVDNAASGRQIICQVGTALNNAYAFGHEKKLKKAAITDMIRNHFEGLNRFERSDFRKYALDAYDYNSFCLAFDIRSTTAPYIMNKHKQYIQNRVLQSAKVDSKDDGIKLDKNGNVEKVINRTTNKVIIGKDVVKTGIIAPDPSKTVSPDESVFNLTCSINHVIAHYNADAYGSEELNEVERLLTNALLHINSPKAMDKVFDISEKTKVA